MISRIKESYLVGVLSDTHGAVSGAVVDAFDGVDHIIHAGDVVSDTVIPDLETIAPVSAVRGNMDGNHRMLPHKTQYLNVNGIGIYVLHDLYLLDIDPAAAGVRMVVHGHTHRARIEWRQGVLYINPGSAAAPRGKRPASVALVRIRDGVLHPEIIPLVG